jgi:hypothetical protein
MAKIYTKSTWVDEVLAASPRYDILDSVGAPVVEDAQIDLATSVVTPGTALSAAIMNNIENGLDAIDTKLDNVTAVRQDFAGTMRVTSNNDPTAGAGLELSYSNPDAYIMAIDRTGAAYKVISIMGDAIKLYADGAHVLTADNGDVFTVPWTDYSALSTITGWSSFTAKKIWYKKVGRLVFVEFDIRGTSNNASSSFTLPFSSNGSKGAFSVIIAQDNSGAFVAGAVNLPESSTTGILFSVPNSNVWTASGTKSALGQFFYETAA